jgi:hypothetical protein
MTASSLKHELVHIKYVCLFSCDDGVCYLTCNRKSLAIHNA